MDHDEMILSLKIKLLLSLTIFYYRMIYQHICHLKMKMFAILNLLHWTPFFWIRTSSYIGITGAAVFSCVGSVCYNKKGGPRDR